MKTLTLSILCLAALALAVAPAALAAGGLIADLDGDGRLEKVVQYDYPTITPPTWLFKTVDLNRDGHPDLIETRGAPELLCNVDTDPMPEAAISDSLMGKPWATGSIAAIGASSKPSIELVFVRGEVTGCHAAQPPMPIQHYVLTVCDPLYSGGSVDIDGDGRADIMWVCD